MTMKTRVSIAFAAAAVGVGVSLAEPVEPLLDVPLRDPAVTRAPDGAYYLTGTAAATQKSDVRSQRSEAADFQNNDGIYVWKSDDRKTWTPLGKVWRLDGGPDRGNELRWTQYLRLNPDDPDGAWVRGVQSPEIHFVRGGVYIAFAMSGGGTGLLRSESGAVEGPYRPHAQITARGGTPSLFQDDAPSGGDGAGPGGAFYWLWDGGWIARLKDDLTGLAEEPRLLRPAVESTLKDGPRQVGDRGAFLFKHAGKYHLVATEITSRLGAACRDTFVARADSVCGPYEPRRLMIPHGGQVTLFTDAEGRPFSTFGGDPQAVFQDRAGIVPLVDDGFLHHLSLMRPTTTEGGPVARVTPVELPGDYGGLRDPQILLAPDGNYYLTGTTGKSTLRVPGCRLWRSPDLRNWTALGDEHGVVWYVDQTEWTSKPFQTAAVPDQPVHDFWAPEIHYARGNYYIPFCMFGGGTGLLRSKTGKPEGPYEDGAGRLHPWAGDPSLFTDDDGTVYMHLGFGPTQLAKMKPDMTGFDGRPFAIGPADGSLLGHEGGYVAKMEGKYVLLYTTLNGEPESERKAKKNFHDFATYDFMYCWADAIRGPYTRARVAVPHGGHGCVFRDKDGRWLAAMFGTDRTAPFRGRLGLVPLDVRIVDGDLRIGPATEAQP